jgi:hypothetical protein
MREREKERNFLKGDSEVIISTVYSPFSRKIKKEIVQ